MKSRGANPSRRPTRTLEQEIAKFAERAGRTPAAVRARLEKDGAMDRIRAGVRREKTMAWLIEKANVTHG